ncbi:hypothetical protein [Streptomyces sp. WM4235]|uniref:hypothetical protein n=1 Tax=Streptomyces sp. WM4235 TaxID=1415551 RepID=UPI00131E8028|nr:hypothetical protein [Streptomyces sp. WM4235]
MKLFSRTTAGVAAGVAAIAVGVAIQGGVFVASAAAADDPLPPVAVETFEYPDAAKIFQQRGIKLKSGDGHIMLAACGEPGLIEVRARRMQDIDTVGHGLFCFRVTGTTGRLDLELPAVIGAKGNDYAVKVNMVTPTETSTEEKSFDLNKNAWTNIGETADPQGRDFTLLQITAAK